MHSAHTAGDISVYPLRISQNLKQLKGQAPLVHNMTNYVVANVTANALLAVGASPVMSNAVNEVEDLGSLVQSLVLNIGTLDNAQVDAMLLALKAAKVKRLPVVLDPVGAGATRYRTDTVLKLLDTQAISVLRGNASEILAVGGVAATTKGVDSQTKSSEAIDCANEISSRFDITVCVSGETDFVVYKDCCLGIVNGHPIMSKVTGMGCIATALIGAFLGFEKNPFLATLSAMALVGVCGEKTAEHEKAPGSFFARFLDELFLVTPEELKNRVRLVQT